MTERWSNAPEASPTTRTQVAVGTTDGPTAEDEARPPSSPRQAVIAELYRRAAELAAAGDVPAARAVNATIGTLLAEPDGPAAEVIDLGAERRSRR